MDNENKTSKSMYMQPQILEMMEIATKSVSSTHEPQYMSQFVTMP